MKFNKAWYDVLKFIAQILLPAAGTLYFSLAGLWNLPAAEQVVGTIIAVDTFLGILLGISTSNYNKSDAKYNGVIEVMETDQKITYAMGLNDEPEDLMNKKEVLFKVEKIHESPGRHEA